MPSAIATQYEPGLWRPSAFRRWDAWVKDTQRAEVGVVPGYWMDRIGFRLAGPEGDGEGVTKDGIIPLEWLGVDYAVTLRQWACETPGIPGFPPASWDAPLGRLQL